MQIVQYYWEVMSRHHNTRAHFVIDKSKIKTLTECAIDVAQKLPNKLHTLYLCKHLLFLVNVSKSWPLMKQGQRLWMKSFLFSGVVRVRQVAVVVKGQRPTEAQGQFLKFKQIKKRAHLWGVGRNLLGHRSKSSSSIIITLNLTWPRNNPAATTFCHVWSIDLFWPLNSSGDNPKNNRDAEKL